jgi:hypothetical protein
MASVEYVTFFSVKEELSSEELYMSIVLRCVVYNALPKAFFDLKVVKKLYKLY